MIDFYDSIKVCSHCKQTIIGTHYFQDRYDEDLNFHHCCLEKAGYENLNGMYIKSSTNEENEICESEAIRKQYDDCALMEIVELLKDEVKQLKDEKLHLIAEKKYLKERLKLKKS